MSPLDDRPWMVLAPRRAPLAGFVQRAARQPPTHGAEIKADDARAVDAVPAGVDADAGVEADAGCVEDDGFAVDDDFVTDDELWGSAPGL